jgi:hypothetical protein
VTKTVWEPYRISSTTSPVVTYFDTTYLFCCLLQHHYLEQTPKYILVENDKQGPHVSLFLLSSPLKISAISLWGSPWWLRGKCAFRKDRRDGRALPAVSRGRRDQPTVSNGVGGALPAGSCPSPCDRPTVTRCQWEEARANNGEARARGGINPLAGLGNADCGSNGYGVKEGGAACAVSWR